jgi:hypothetical protein
LRDEAARVFGAVGESNAHARGDQELLAVQLDGLAHGLAEALGAAGVERPRIPRSR